MRAYLVAFFIGIFCGVTFSAGATGKPLSVNSETLYREMNLQGIIDYPAFKRAITGYNRVGGSEKGILTVIDFTKPSTDKRLYVIDLQAKKILFVSHVAHGRNSGENYARAFSNREGSYMSSLGFYRTEGTYQGKNGYSLVLEGLEKGINDKAKERAIVVHGAPYADPSVIRSSGRLGRSLGCPALPPDVSKQIIDTIKEGTLLYIHGNDESYASTSVLYSK